MQPALSPLLAGIASSAADERRVPEPADVWVNAGPGPAVLFPESSHLRSFWSPSALLPTGAVAEQEPPMPVCLLSSLRGRFRGSYRASLAQYDGARPWVDG